MEGQLLAWALGRLARQPLAWLLWFALLGVPLLLPRLSRLGVQSEVFDYQAFTADLVFVWLLVGGVQGLAAAGELAAWVDGLGIQRRWRARCACVAFPMFLPAVPILSWLAVGEQAAAARVLPSLALAALMLLALALLVDRIPLPAVRAWIFLGLAWWLPALAPNLPAAWSVILHPGVGPTELSGSSTSGAWLSGFGSILATVSIALGLDFVRRPAP